MRSVTCPSCGFVSWAVGGDCKQCGQPLPLNQTYHRPTPPPAYGYDAYGYDAPPDYFGAPLKKRTGHAVASLVIGIIGFFTFGILFIGSIVGTVLGVVALKKGNREPATYGGKGLAIAGIIMNVVALVSIVPIGIVAAIAIPNLLAARRAANEASALNTIRTIMTAEARYQATDGDGEFGRLDDLVKSGHIDRQFLSGVKNGYRFILVNYGDDFEVTATPVSEAGRRSFFYSSTDDQIRARFDGRPATEDDPPLDFYNNSEPSRRAAPRGLSGPAYIPTN